MVRLLCCVWLSLVGVANSFAEALPLIAPKPHRVFQRVGYDPTLASKEDLGSPSWGMADIPIEAPLPRGAAGGVWEYRVVLLAGGQGKERPWAALDDVQTMSTLRGSARVPAGGWYRLDVRLRQQDQVRATFAVEPIGVGEVFIVAGQSYATNCNDERLKVTEPAQRVVAYDFAKQNWGVAHDPQPVADKSDGGSIWPPLGDALVKEWRVPVAFANVAVGATSSEQWQPSGPLHTRLIDVGRTLGRFRAVLWQQGESDVIAKTSTATYVANIRKIRHAAATAWKVEAPWLLAKSTLHPTVYNDPPGEERIRAGVDELVTLPGFSAGPDTDTLKGESRGGPQSRRHFSAIGQRKAADMWFAVLKQLVSVPRPMRESINDCHLLEPVWQAAVVHRESSTLLQLQPEGPITARLAYPAKRLLRVDTADGQRRIDLASITLADDGQTLTLKAPTPIEFIPASAFFPPKNTPNSYRHRASNPEQNLLYRPGRWFHDRNLEITYERRTAGKPLPATTALPKTAALLRAGQSLVLGISGDSISTGLDSSLTGKAPPYQTGYAELVAAQLETTFRVPVALKNRAVSGWSIANGVADLDKLMAEKPNLIIVAYGMNDVGRRDPAWFGKQCRTLLERIQSANKDIEVVFVSPMLGHAEWVHTPREMFAKYRDELKAITREGVALADVTAVWQQQLQHKHDLDLTGNGLNHPNDYGHRLYAQTILSVLPKQGQ